VVASDQVSGCIRSVGDGHYQMLRTIFISCVIITPTSAAAAAAAATSLTVMIMTIIINDNDNKD